MASVSDEYEENWEEEEAPVGKKSLVSTADGQVFPLERDEYDVTRDVEPTQQEELGSSIPHNAGIPEDQLQGDNNDFNHVEQPAKPKEAVASVVSEEIPTSDDSLSSLENENVNSPNAHMFSSALPDTSEEHGLLGLVRIHGRHYSRQNSPPIQTEMKSADSREAKLPPRVDSGALQARIASQRIAEFRRRQALKAEKERASESVWAQNRRDIRRSNGAMHNALGVAGLSAQDHLRLAQYRRKLEMKQREVAASRERQNRWYNCIPKRPASAPEHIRELQVRYNQQKRVWERTTRHKQKSIHQNQLELQQKAQAIITKEDGAYIHGSYLLKVKPHTTTKQAQSPPSEHKEVHAEC